MAVKWHEFLLKDIDSTFRRIESEFSLKDKIDSAILSPDTNLEQVLQEVCKDFQSLAMASSIEILLVSDNELIPMGLNAASKKRAKVYKTLWNTMVSSELQYAEYKEDNAQISSEIIYCFSVPVDGSIFMLLVLGRDEVSRQSIRHAEFMRLAQLIPNQLGMLITKHIEACRARTQNSLISLFFNNKLKPTTCWNKIANQISLFLPDWKPLLIEPSPKVQFLSYKTGDRHLKILATQGDEEIGTEVLVDSSICGMLVQNPEKEYVCVDPHKHLDRYSAFLLDQETDIPHSELAVSIKHNGDIIGIINLEHRKKKVFKAQHIENVLSVAKFLAPFVDALQVRHEVQRSKEIGILYTINHLLGRSSRIYSHLLGQPIVKIRFTLSKIRSAVAKGESIQEINNNLDKLGRYVDDIANSSNRFCQNLPAIMGYGSTNVERMIDGALSVFNRNILETEEKITFDIQVHPDVKPVFASRLLQEHVYNLINNSLYAVREAQAKDPNRNGVIRIFVTAREVKDKLNRATASKLVLFEITDNGTGAPREVENKIGQPEFTTKGTKGTGYGLAAAIEYVQSLGGNLTFYNMPGEGFKVNFHLEKYDEKKHS